MIAGRRSFERGLLYAANGSVGRRTATKTTVKANVRGSASYQVKLWLDEDNVGRLMKAAGREADFPPYTSALRLKHKPKRNLMKLFDGKRW